MKYKVKTKDCHLIVRAKTSFKENFDEKEIDLFSRTCSRGFLKPKRIKKNLVEYTGPVAVSLHERLKKPLSKREFYLILEQIIVCIRKLNADGMPINNLVMDLEQIYINEVTKEVQFLYVPLLQPRFNTTANELIESIVYSTQPGDATDNEFVERFVYFFRSLKVFSVDKIEQYIAKEDNSAIQTINKQSTGKSGFMTDKQQHYYEHYSHDRGVVDEEDTALLDGDEATDLLKEEMDLGSEATGLLDAEEATGLLVEADSEETALLSDEVKQHFPSLLRVKTDERVVIDKPVFRIGKEKSCVDYMVSDNIAVSRRHADIIIRGDKIYVKDLNSKNHTYINEEEVSGQYEVEIYDGDSLKLADEEFIFYT